MENGRAMVHMLREHKKIVYNHSLKTRWANNSETTTGGIIYTIALYGKLKASG